MLKVSFYLRKQSFVKGFPENKIYLLVYAQKKGYTKSALFDFDKIKDDTKPTAFLTEKELQKLETLHLEDKETAFIRDVFIFCAYTGFLHSDLKDFDAKKHLIQDQEGDLWIIKPRSKTNETIKQLIHPKAKAILEKYGYCIKPEYEVKHNRTLKVLAKVCGIDKEISIRVARRTFAILCRNTFGFPDEITYQLMGHKDTRNLQKHYALTTDENIKKHLKGFYAQIEQQEKERQINASTNENLILKEIKQIREHLEGLNKKSPHSGI